MSVLTQQRLRNVLFLSIFPLRRVVRRKSVQRPDLPMTQESFTGVARDVFVFAVIDWSLRVQHLLYIARSLAEAGRRVFYFSQHFVCTDMPSCQIRLHVTAGPTICFDELPSVSIAKLLPDTCRSYDCIGQYKGLANLSEKLIAIEKEMLVTPATNPVKVREYLVAGKSVVCGDLPEIDKDVAKKWVGQ